MTFSRYGSPKDVELAFYEAFQGADLDAMRAVWDDGDDIVCVHPMGPKLVGYEAVMKSWSDILGSGAQLSFRVDNIQIMADGGISVHCVHENITQGRHGELRGLVIATNVYRATDNGWRMVLHHGSPGAVETAQAQRQHVVH
ncbi:MAG: YybH family protein [Gammaproteobacteria bacterium]